MRFFDEDNHQFEWTIGVVLTMIVLYLGSYLIVRVRNTSSCEADGCYNEVVDIPQKGFWTLYAPVMAIDHKYFRAEFPAN
jgi:hypothetical protein